MSQQEPPAYTSYPTGGLQSADRVLPPPSKTKAGWALGLAIIPAPLAWIVSIVLSIQVISDSKHRPGNGKGMAVAALIIIPVWIVLVIAIVVATTVDDAERDVAGTVTGAGDVRSNQVRTGDCTADNLAEQTYLTIELTPCGSPHYFEAFANFTLPDGAFPGQDVVDRLADGGCAKRFEGYVGTSFDASELDVMFLRPLESSWAADRGVTCLASDGTSTTGSLKGSKR